MNQIFSWIVVVLLILLGMFLFSNNSIRARKIRGKTAQATAPSYSFCHRCEMPWKFIEGHTTPYGKEITRMIKSGESINMNWGGCFPLCKRCWKELRTPEKRLQYYRELWIEWQQWGNKDAEEWEHIKISVLAGY